MASLRRPDGLIALLGALLILTDARIPWGASRLKREVGSELAKELEKQNLFFPAGHCEGICIGGYLLQGGYGANRLKTVA